MISEVAKHRALFEPYCVGSGLDVASGGDTGVAWAISLDLPAEEAARYTTTDFGLSPIHLRGDCRNLYWFRDGVLDFVIASHILEDFLQADQPQALAEWGRVIRPGGHLIVMYPETKLWAAAVDAGQPCNANHQYEPRAHEVADVLRGMGWLIVEDRRCSEDDFGWLSIGKKP